MNKFKLIKNNNSKNIYSLFGIIFCTVLLIIGTTTAYFTQSDSKDIDSIVTTNINDTLKYTDDTTYMRQELIPSKEEVAKQAYNIIGENKCLDKYGYSACSVYQFNIKNIANVSQELIIDMIPTVNTFTNLYFMLYELDEDGNTIGEPTAKQIDKLTDEMIQNNNITPINLKQELVLNSNRDKTYEIVFFVNDTGEDQTELDAGKNFGASIKITSVATGQYISKNFGTSCWTTELLSDGTYKLKYFNGIDNNLTIKDEDGNEIENPNYGVIDSSCTGYIDDDDEDGYYSVYIPSNVGGEEISTLGNELFNAVDLTTYNVNIYSKINNIYIEDDIRYFEDGNANTFAGTFLGVGLLDIQEITLSPVTVDLPSTLVEIGDLAFMYSGVNNVVFRENEFGETNLKEFGANSFTGTLISELNIPDSVTTINDRAFSGANLSSITIPTNVTKIGKGAFDSNSKLNTVEFAGIESNTNQLTEIGEGAFNSTSLTTITIPQNVKKLVNIFPSTLTSVTFAGIEDNTNQLTEIGDSAFYNTSITLITIPSSVEKIGKYAFMDIESLTILTFEEDSNLTTIGDSAFSGTSIISITIPKSVTTIGDSAFSENTSLTTLTFKEDSNLTTIGDSAFYNTSITLITIPSSVEKIGKYAFRDIESLTTLTFEEDGNLWTIGDSAFSDCDLTYTDPANPLVIPSSVTAIGERAFYSFEYGSSDTIPLNRNLDFIRFEGTLTLGNTDWYHAGYTTLNP